MAKGHRRKGYTRADGTRVKATYVRPSRKRGATRGSKYSASQEKARAIARLRHEVREGEPPRLLRKYVRDAREAGVSKAVIQRALAGHTRGSKRSVRSKGPHVFYLPKGLSRAEAWQRSRARARRGDFRGFSYNAKTGRASLM